MSLRDLQRKAKQSRAVLSKMDCRGFLRNLAMTEDDGQIDVLSLATQGEAIQCGSLQNGLPRFLAEPRNDRGRWTNPMSLRDLQRKAKQSSAVLTKMDCRGFLRNIAMTGGEEQIRCHETCSARRSNPVRFFAKWIAAVSCETSQ